MRSGTEDDVERALNTLLGELAPGRYQCRVRKGAGDSAIGKPADLEIVSKVVPATVAVAVEVANVNTTQLVGEACRLYYDACPRKLLVLGDRNVPADGKRQCEALLAKLYGQDSIQNTPARVVWYDDDEDIAKALADLLLV